MMGLLGSNSAPEARCALVLAEGNDNSVAITANLQRLMTVGFLLVGVSSPDSSSHESNRMMVAA